MDLLFICLAPLWQPGRAAVSWSYVPLSWAPDADPNAPYRGGTTNSRSFGLNQEPTRWRSLLGSVACVVGQREAHNLGGVQVKLSIIWKTRDTAKPSSRLDSYGFTRLTPPSEWQSSAPALQQKLAWISQSLETLWLPRTGGCRSAPVIRQWRRRPLLAEARDAKGLAIRRGDQRFAELAIAKLFRAARGHLLSLTPSSRLFAGRTWTIRRRILVYKPLI
jgi:hypothetical protein